jgi:hypothetical protein
MQEESTETESCFVAIAGLNRVYDPGCGKDPSSKKHPCPDCHFCQSCSDARCHACRSEKYRPCRKQHCRKLSLREQIALYEQFNHPTA